MKKILLSSISVFLFLGCRLNCHLEKEQTHKIAIPIVKVLAEYSKQNGIPKSFNDIKNFPYAIKPCSKKLDLAECKSVKNGYFFKKGNEYYSINIVWFPTKESPIGFGLNIVRNTTYCVYEIYDDDKIDANYLKPACSLIGSCKGWGKQ